MKIWGFWENDKIVLFFRKFGQWCEWAVIASCLDGRFWSEVDVSELWRRLSAKRWIPDAPSKKSHIRESKALMLCRAARMWDVELWYLEEAMGPFSADGVWMEGSGLGLGCRKILCLFGAFVLRIYSHWLVFVCGLWRNFQVVDKCTSVLYLELEDWLWGLCIIISYSEGTSVASQTMHSK